jgi:hypothetical protein
MQEGEAIGMNTATVFGNKYAAEKREVSIDALLAKFADPPVRPRKEACELFSLGRFGEIRSGNDSLRHDGNVLSITGIAGDYDGEQVPIEDARDTLGTYGIKATLYTSPSHKPEAPRWRVVCRLSREMCKQEHGRLMARLNGVLGGILATESFDLSRSYYFGKVKGTEYQVLTIDGLCIDELPELDDLAIGKTGPAKPGNGAAAHAGRMADDDLRDVILGGVAGRIYTSLLTLTARLAGRGKTAEAIVLDLQSLLNRAAWQSADPITWQARVKALPKMAQSAVEKYAPKRPKPNFVTGGILTLARSMPPVRYVARPMLVAGQLGTLTGHPGSGKTTFVAGMFAAWATGRAYGPLDLATDGLLYIVSAEDFDGTRNRIFAEAARLRLTDLERVTLDEHLRWVQVVSGASPAEIQAEIARDATGRPVVAVFVDTGPALFPGDDENDNVALRDYVRGFLPMAALPGTPVTVLAWHPSKGAGPDRLEPRGASAIKGTCDFNLTIHADDERRVAIAYTKVRTAHFDALEGTITGVTIEAADGRLIDVPVLTLEMGDIAGRGDAKDAREKLLRYMRSRREAGVRDIAAATGLSKSAVGRHLSHLAASRPPLVAKDAVSDAYSLTKVGRERADRIADHGANYAHAKDPG